MTIMAATLTSLLSKQGFLIWSIWPGKVDERGRLLLEDRSKGGVAIAACLETVTGGSYSLWRDRRGVTMGEHQLVE